MRHAAGEAVQDRFHLLRLDVAAPRHSGARHLLRGDSFASFSPALDVASWVAPAASSSPSTCRRREMFTTSAPMTTGLKSDERHAAQINTLLA